MNAPAGSASATTEVTVRGIAAGGAGVADLPDGRVVFVPRTAPGDRALIRLVKERPRWAEGALERIVERAEARVSPPCPLYDRCGGCQLQHLPYETQLEWKGRIVADALERIGGIHMPPPAVVASPQALGYRSRASFTLRRLRGGRVVAGFHALARPAHVVDVDACLLVEPAVAEAWRALRAAWGPRAAALPEAGRLRLTLRAVEEGVELLVEGGTPGWDSSKLASAVPSLSAVRHRPDGGGVAFEQVNRDAAALLRDHVLDRIDAAAGMPPGSEPAGPEGAAEHTTAPRAVDAYCGVGVYGRALAGRGWKVTGIELDRATAELAATDAPAGFEVRIGPAEEHLAEALPADLVVLNPPRAGVESAVTDQLLAHPPRVLVYVSCDPATLARDLRRLAPALTPTEVTAFDLFPQTAHVETVVVLS